MYLFWYGSRVWQVRLDKRYEEDLDGFPLGLPKEDILARLGDPYYSDDESFVYVLPDQGYPVRLRLFFGDNLVTDLYIYRGDF